MEGRILFWGRGRLFCGKEKISGGREKLLLRGKGKTFCGKEKTFLGKLWDCLDFRIINVNFVAEKKKY